MPRILLSLLPLLLLSGCGTPAAKIQARATAGGGAPVVAPTAAATRAPAESAPAASTPGTPVETSRLLPLETPGMPRPPGSVAPDPGPESLRRAGPDRGAAFLDDFARSYYRGRSGQVYFVTRPGYFLTAWGAAFNHGSPWDYDTHVPLVFYGPGQVRQAQVTAGTPQPYDIPCTLALAAGIPRPGSMKGRSWHEILEPKRPPVKAMLVVVMDQVGFHDVERFQEKMPNLTRFRNQGADFPRTRIHYLPTFTAVSHAGVGTGAPPAIHGIVSNKIPGEDGNLRVVFRRPGGTVDPGDSLVPTLGDYLDLLHGNRSVVIGQVYAEYAVTGATSHGAHFPGADRDVVVWHGRDGALRTDPRWFRMPEYLAGRSSVSLAKQHGGRYHGFDAGKVPGVHQASWYAEWEAANLLEMMKKEEVGRDEVPDLVVVNLKSTDSFGHDHGHDHVGFQEILSTVDSFLGRAEAQLREAAGEGGYLIAVTGDHGLVPDDGARLQEQDFVAWLQAHLDAIGDQDGYGGVQDFFGGQVYLDMEELREDGNSLETVAELLARDPAILHVWTEDQVRDRQGRVMSLLDQRTRK